MGSLRTGWGRSRGVQGPLEAMGEWEGQGCFVLRLKGPGGKVGHNRNLQDHFRWGMERKFPNTTRTELYEVVLNCWPKNESYVCTECLGKLWKFNLETKMFPFFLFVWLIRDMNNSVLIHRLMSKVKSVCWSKLLMFAILMANDF